MRGNSLKLGVLGLTISLTACTTGPANAVDASSACRIKHDESHHVGETISFRGEYDSDGIERAIVMPAGCDSGFGVGTIAPALVTQMDSHVLPGFYPARKIDAVFTGQLVQSTPNTAQFRLDDGVRINITAVQGIRP